MALPPSLPLHCIAFLGFAPCIAFLETKRGELIPWNKSECEGRVVVLDVHIH